LARLYACDLSRRLVEGRAASDKPSFRRCVSRAAGSVLSRHDDICRRVASERRSLVRPSPGSELPTFGGLPSRLRIRGSRFHPAERSSLCSNVIVTTVRARRTLDPGDGTWSTTTPITGGGRSLAPATRPRQHPLDTAPLRITPSYTTPRDTAVVMWWTVRGDRLRPPMGAQFSAVVVICQRVRDFPFLSRLTRPSRRRAQERCRTLPHRRDNWAPTVRIRSRRISEFPRSS
jgi:hypothetical protein